MTDTTSSHPVRRASREAATSRALALRARDVRPSGWLYVLPALSAYCLFVFWPVIQTFRYSLYRWDGVAEATWVGSGQLQAVFSDIELVGSLEHAFQLILFFTGIPVTLACWSRPSCTGWPRAV